MTTSFIDNIRDIAPDDTIDTICTLCGKGDYRSYLFRDLPDGSVFLFVDKEESELSAVRFIYSDITAYPSGDLHLPESTLKAVVEAIMTSPGFDGSGMRSGQTVVVCNTSKETDKAAITDMLRERFGAVTTRFFI